MAILSASHLLEQAERLIVPPPAGPPRQVDVRRAISAAYYAVFHNVTTAAADEYVGAVHRNSIRYALVYRSVDHRALRELCADVAKPTLPAKIRKYFDPAGPGVELQAFASAVVELQEKRHLADYDPSGRHKTSDAKLAVATARTAIGRFVAADQEKRRMLLALLLFSSR